jgi:LysR family transcriptional regulator, transcriptional activator of nodD3 and syrA
VTRRALADIDLNLLVALDALLREESVTRAASHLGLTQSATSRALNRLRAELDDPLLVRRGPALTKTPLAEKLFPEVVTAIEAVGRVFDARLTFEPARAVRRFTMFASDYAQAVVVPLLARLHIAAPGVDLVVRVAREPERSLADRDAALMIGPTRDALVSLKRQLLFTDRLVVMARAGHPALADLTLERYCAASHVLVSPRALRGGIVDDALRARGVERRVALEVPHFLVAPIVVADSDLLVTLPARLAERVAPRLGLATAPLPVETPPIEFMQLWHERDHADAGNAWLRAQVVEAVRAL